MGCTSGVGHVLGGNFLPDQPVRIYGSAGVSGGGRRYPDGDCPAVLFPTDRTLFVCGCACRRFVVLCHVYTVHNDKNSLILFEAERDSLLFRQMEKVGLAPSDSIPDDLYPDILRLDLDSALYVFGEISVYRSSPDSAYTVSYMGGGYYLKKRVSLPTRNK